MDLPLDIDSGLTDEMKEVRQTIHRFSAEVLRPAAQLRLRTFRTRRVATATL
jgi:hypothetical protein